MENWVCLQGDALTKTSHGDTFTESMMSWHLKSVVTAESMELKLVIFNDNDIKFDKASSFPNEIYFQFQKGQFLNDDRANGFWGILSNSMTHLMTMQMGLSFLCQHNTMH